MVSVGVVRLNDGRKALCRGIGGDETDVRGLGNTKFWINEPRTRIAMWPGSYITS